MNHNYYIKRCFELAEKGKGTVSPNPLVGAVIVKNDKIISEGWHRFPGSDHAEADAIKNCKDDLSGATLYCNLEPCCHTNKRTPPCAPLIISSGIKKVVIANIDPNPAVAGKGVAMMREAGIEVITGILEEEGAELNKFFFHSVTTGKPYTILKIASSLDGYITESRGKQTWLTGEQSAVYVHSLRAEYDALLVGANTVLVDDPRLNVRHVEGRDPLKIVLDGNLTIQEDAFIIKNSPEKLIVFTSDNADAEKTRRLSDLGVKVIKLPTSPAGILDLGKVLNELHKMNITSLMVEGGGNIFSQFINHDYFNELHLLYAPIILGRGLNFAILAERKRITIADVIKSGEDIITILKK